MSRSLKKGPFVDTPLLEKIEAMNRGEREEGRQDLVAPFDGGSRDGGHTIAVHNGRKFIPVYVTENMVGHKLGEFSPTRQFKGHTTKTEKAAQMAAAAAPAGRRAAVAARRRAGSHGD